MILISRGLLGSNTLTDFPKDNYTKISESLMKKKNQKKTTLTSFSFSNPLNKVFNSSFFLSGKLIVVISFQILPLYLSVFILDQPRLTYLGLVASRFSTFLNKAGGGPGGGGSSPGECKNSPGGGGGGGGGGGACVPGGCENSPGGGGGGGGGPDCPECETIGNGGDGGGSLSRENHSRCRGGADSPDCEVICGA